MVGHETGLAGTDTLGYAPALGNRRARRAARVSLVVAVTVAAWQWSGPWRAQGRYLYDQHQAMTYAPPADRVVFDNDPVVAKALVRNNRAYRPPARPLFNRPWYPVPPRAWHPPAFYYDPSFDRLALAESVSWGLVFAHRRRAPTGAERLVCVEVGCAAFGPEGTTVVLLPKAYAPRPLAPGRDPQMGHATGPAVPTVGPAEPPDRWPAASAAVRRPAGPGGPGALHDRIRHRRDGRYNRRLVAKPRAVHVVLRSRSAHRACRTEGSRRPGVTDAGGRGRVRRRARRRDGGR